MLSLAMRNQNMITILGIDFFNCQAQDVVDILKSGGLLVVPAAPALINVKTDPDYYDALLNADVVIPDSGYMVLLWNILHRQKIKRISGLELLIAFLNDSGVQHSSNLLLVDPTKTDAEQNLNYLNQHGFNITSDKSYLAPLYNKSNVVDEELLNKIELEKPKYILLNLGGGVQEKLGKYLKQNLSYQPAIICTGAAIAFLTGQQAKIPNWADKLFLGWLFRCIRNPKLYVPRYFKSFKLATYLFRYGKHQPY